MKSSICIYFFVFALFFGSNFFSYTLQAQQITGWVKDSHDSTAIGFASVQFIGTNHGLTADASGKFSFNPDQYGVRKIVVGFLGYFPDTVEIRAGMKEVVVYLQVKSEMLGKVTVEGKRDASHISTTTARNAQVISSSGIQRLACCSLAESFENNATVDVGYSDAVSGAKHIQMLGLSGVYSQLLVENQPSVRLLSGVYGLNYIPGPWLSTISISKGTSSVVQGYESLTGQINIDLKKPESSEKFYLEYFTNDFLKQELNIHGSRRLHPNLSSVLFLHGASTQTTNDRNDDGFLDVPKSNLFVASNRYFYNNENRIRSRFGFDLLYEDRIGGQEGYKPNESSLPPEFYGVKLRNRRIHLFENTGILFNAERHGSIGINANFVYHDMDALFGLTDYNPVQTSGFLTVLLNSDIADKSHKISTGLSYQYDHLEEPFQDTLFEREEGVAGAFAEYTFNVTGFTLIAGIRGDYNSFYEEFYATPRLHVKYAPNTHTALRLSAGRGLRTANILAEHLSILTSSRAVIFREMPKIEDGWNAGLSFTRSVELGNSRKMSINADFYHTFFTNQIIVDLEEDVHKAFIYNLIGEAFSNSFQVDFFIEPFKRFDITFAYRYNDSRTTMNGKLIQTPLVAQHKSLLAFHYATKYERWNFSFTTQYHGRTRLPDTHANPEVYRLGSSSPDFFILHAQITRKFKKTEWYIGVEDLTNYKQKNPILASNDPFGPYFDSSIIYGPVIGRQFNFGLRIKIK